MVIAQGSKITANDINDIVTMLNDESYTRSTGLTDLSSVSAGNSINASFFKGSFHHDFFSNSSVSGNWTQDTTYGSITETTSLSISNVHTGSVSTNNPANYTHLYSSLNYDASKNNVTIVKVTEMNYTTPTSYACASGIILKDSNNYGLILVIEGQVQASALTAQNIYFRTHTSGGDSTIAMPDAISLSNTSPASLKRPVYLKLENVGTTYYASYSVDGTTWTAVGNTSFATVTPIYAALGYCVSYTVSSSAKFGEFFTYINDTPSMIIQSILINQSHCYCQADAYIEGRMGGTSLDMSAEPYGFSKGDKIDASTLMYIYTDADNLRVQCGCDLNSDTIGCSCNTNVCTNVSNCSTVCTTNPTCSNVAVCTNNGVCTNQVYCNCQSNTCTNQVKCTCNKVLTICFCQSACTCNKICTNVANCQNNTVVSCGTNPSCTNQTNSCSNVSNCSSVCSNNQVCTNVSDCTCNTVCNCEYN